jgi:hypothetical protein
MSLFQPEVGGWLKVVNNHTVINGNIVFISDTHFQIEGLPKLRRDEWGFIIVKPAPGRTVGIRELRKQNGEDR